MKDLDKKIESFWEWFSGKEKEIRQTIEEGNNSEKNLLVEEINNRVLDFGRLSWELNGENSKDLVFIISPNTSLELFAITKQIMEQAPSLKQWTFFPFRPPVDWDFQLPYYDDFMNEKEVNVQEWKFRIKKEKNEKITILFYAENLTEPVQELKEAIMEQATVNMMGEEIRLLNIEKLVLENNKEQQYLPINELQEEIKKHTNG
jgi:hypothetical protein